MIGYIVWAGSPRSAPPKGSLTPHQGAMHVQLAGPLACILRFCLYARPRRPRGPTLHAADSRSASLRACCVPLTQTINPNSLRIETNFSL